MKGRWREGHWRHASYEGKMEEQLAASRPVMKGRWRDLDTQASQL